MAQVLPDICRRKHGGNENSEAANARVHSQKAADNKRIIAYADFIGSYGITFKEVVKELDMLPQTASARLADLKKDVELVPKPNADKRDGCGVFIRPQFLRPKGQLSLGLVK